MEESICDHLLKSSTNCGVGGCSGSCVQVPPEVVGTGVHEFKQISVLSGLCFLDSTFASVHLNWKITHGLVVAVGNQLTLQTPLLLTFGGACTFHGCTHYGTRCSAT